MREGISYIAKRFSKADNKNMKNHMMIVSQENISSI